MTGRTAEAPGFSGKLAGSGWLCHRDIDCRMLVCRRYRMAYPRQLLRPAGIGQKTIVADTHQPFGQHMQQEPSDKFLDRQMHQLPADAVLGVLVTERLFILLQGDDPRVADSSPMSVSRQVVDHPISGFQVGLIFITNGLI